MKEKANIQELVIDGKTYVPKESTNQPAEQRDGMPYVMIRTYSAGVHCGYLKRREGKEVELLDSIRIWYWNGAASLSQLAMEGTSKPDNCKFGVPITTPLILTEAIEIITMTEVAKQSIQGVRSWKE
jgi:hypothetical protein